MTYSAYKILREISLCDFGAIDKEYIKAMEDTAMFAQLYLAKTVKDLQVEIISEIKKSRLKDFWLVEDMLK